MSKLTVEKKNSKKADAILRRLLSTNEKDLPEANIEFTYVKTIPEEAAKKQAATYYRQICKVANAKGIRCLN